MDNMGLDKKGVWACFRKCSVSRMMSGMLII